MLGHCLAAILCCVGMGRLLRLQPVPGGTTDHCSDYVRNASWLITFVKGKFQTKIIDKIVIMNKFYFSIWCKHIKVLE